MKVIGLIIKKKEREYFINSHYNEDMREDLKIIKKMA